MPMAPELVDLRGAKAGAARLYPAGHPLREALTGEPDFIPRTQAEGLLTAYLRMALTYRQP
jgi:hypothetical protein